MRYLLLAVMAAFACSCATVVRGTSETAQFESAPSGADVTAESISEDKMGPYHCVTPCQLELKRKRTWRVDYALEGHKPVSGLLKPVLTGGGVAAGAGNALIGGLIGVGIDAGTGANLDLRPNPMIAELEPVDSPEMSRILDAEIITDENIVEPDADEPGADETVGEPAAEESVMEEGAAEEDAEVEGPSDESVPESRETDEPAPADDPQTEDEDQDSENADEMDPVASAKSINSDTSDAENPLVAVEFSNPSSEALDDAEIRRYKPGERAPNDEDADRLNRLQLEKTRATVNQD